MCDGRFHRPTIENYRAANRRNIYRHSFVTRSRFRFVSLRSDCDYTNNLVGQSRSARIRRDFLEKFRNEMGTFNKPPGKRYEFVYEATRYYVRARRCTFIIRVSRRRFVKSRNNRRDLATNRTYPETVRVNRRQANVPRTIGSGHTRK